MTNDTPTAPHRDQPGNGVALLIIDVINRFDFPDAADLRDRAARAGEAILRLRDRAGDANVPVLYVNDNFGEWHSDREQIVARAAEAMTDRALCPRDADYFVIKPQFSGFYATNLAVLLPKLGVRRLVLTGIATDICVLFTAADAHMRDYALWVPEDAVAAGDDARHCAALDIMRATFGADTRTTAARDFADW